MSLSDADDLALTFEKVSLLHVMIHVGKINDFLIFWIRMKCIAN